MRLTIAASGRAQRGGGRRPLPASIGIGYRQPGGAVHPFEAMETRRAEADGGWGMGAGKRVARVIAAIVAAMVAAQAIAGEHWKFNLVNQSHKTALEFRTQQNGQWSANWIRESIEPGDRFNMDFGASDGVCAIPTQIHFADGSQFDARVDYCKVSNIYIHDNGLTWD